jgi:hypothetical protein
MKLMAVTYVHGMVHESYSYSESTVSPFLGVHWQGRETDHSLFSSAEIVNVRSNTNTDSNYNELYIHWPESVEIFGFQHLFKFSHASITY